MRLDDARLCLDCEEIHDQQVCPACGSEAFGFIRRWIRSASDGGARTMPPPQPSTPRPRQPPDREELDAWRQIVEGKKDRPSGIRRVGGKLLTGGLVGLAAMGLAGWAWTRKDEPAGTPSPSGAEDAGKPEKPPEA